MIKICHIANHLTGKADGVYAHLKMIFQNSDNEKFQHYLIFQGKEKIENELSELGIKYFVSESLNNMISLKAFIDVYKFIKQNEISIIHAHLVKPYSIGGLVNIILRRKLIFNYHGLFIYNNIYNGILEKIIYGSIHYLINLFKVVNIVLVPSKRSKKLLLSETKLFPEPLIYYNGFDSTKKKEIVNEQLLNRIKKIKEDEILIAIVGRLEVDKRIDKAINIFKKIISKNYKAHLLVIGDGKLETKLKNLANELNLSQHIEFLGFVKNASDYFYLFDVILFTSDWEGMPVTIWEAMANKVPVVAPDVGGFKEILEENNCGLIYKPNDLNEAEIKLENLIEDYALRKQLGENGKRAIDEKFNVNNFIKQIDNIYLNL
ncbi:MAG TPA: glycosyltransferase [Ignavibacteriaceae bacterium]|nr:glycosyltransferase [Ignavibacteriaceae bacterium]